MRPRSAPHWTTSIIHLAALHSDTTLDGETEGMRQRHFQIKLRQSGLFFFNIWAFCWFSLDLSVRNRLSSSELLTADLIWFSGFYHFS